MSPTPILMPAADNDLDQIFQFCGRAHVTPTQPGSVGLGLLVARHLARLMGGDLAYRGEDGWTVFEVTVPRTGGLRAIS